MSDQRVIDCDTHFWESLSIWTDYLDPAFRDGAPRFVHDGDRLLVQVGESVYPSGPQHRGLGSTYGPDETLHERTIWDKEVSTDPLRRLKFMDSQGTAVHIILPDARHGRIRFHQGPRAGGCLRPRVPSMSRRSAPGRPLSASTATPGGTPCSTCAPTPSSRSWPSWT
jgi:hypothetical protein